MYFRDRVDAGQRLARHLAAYAARPDTLVLALPRGGVPVGYEVARVLELPLDVFLVRKLGVPGHEELALGAVATGGVRVLNPEVTRHLRLADRVIARVTERELQELERQHQAYRGQRTFPALSGQTVILVDDGLATGSSMRAAAAAVRQQAPARVVVAVPVAAAETCAALGSHVDEVACAISPEPFHAVGLWYEDFAQTTDDEVRDLLRRSAARQAGSHPP